MISFVAKEAVDSIKPVAKNSRLQLIDNFVVYLRHMHATLTSPGRDNAHKKSIGRRRIFAHNLRPRSFNHAPHKFRQVVTRKTSHAPSRFSERHTMYAHKRPFRTNTPVLHLFSFILLLCMAACFERSRFVLCASHSYDHFTQSDTGEIVYHFGFLACLFSVNIRKNVMLLLHNFDIA